MTSKEDEMKAKGLKERYIPKFKRELEEGITEDAIVRMVTVMHNVGQVTRAQANTIIDCLWIAKSELRQKEKGG